MHVCGYVILFCAPFNAKTKAEKITRAEAADVDNGGRVTDLNGMSFPGTICSGVTTLMYVLSNLAPSLASSTVTFRSAGLGSSAGLGISMRSGTAPGSLDGTGRCWSSRIDRPVTERRIE